MYVLYRQSSGAPKESKQGGGKGGKKGKKKSFDVVQSSNPKQKYHQQRGAGKERGKGEGSRVDQQHKQKAPLLVTVSETETMDHEQKQSAAQTSEQEPASMSLEPASVSHEPVSVSHELSVEDSGTACTQGMRASDEVNSVPKSKETEDSHEASKEGLALEGPECGKTDTGPLVSAAEETTEQSEHHATETPAESSHTQDVPTQVGWCHVCCVTTE